ncbi:MFS transporter [Halobacillus salinarum]|uniref:MFS transporter n=1 Tax=Halobacillus salinarum TaxID=2932257 RepID=A0ABY4EL91_9BACI|nr:MFS transporter [Halobacillus salinarum]UOQ44787.1 MFS transporter [Halobacillus salinarum]
MKPSQPYTPKQAEFWRVTIAFMLASLLTFSTLYAFQPLLPLFVDEFHVSVTQSSLLVSAAVVSMVVGLFILGFAADRYGRLSLMRISLIATVVILCILPLVPSFHWMVLLRLLQGFFLAGIPAAAMGYLGEEISQNDLGLAMTLYISSNALGGMGGRVIAGYLADVWSWQATIYILAGFGLAASLLFILLLPKERFFTKEDKPLREDLRGMLIHLTDRRLLGLFLMGLVLQILFTAIWTYLPFYLQAPPYEWPLKWISFTYLAYILGVLGPPLAGRISNRYGLPAVMLSGVVVLLVGAWLTAVPPVFFIVLGLALLCSGFFVAHSMAAALVSKTADHHRSGASGFYLISYYIGVAIGSTAIGKLWESFQWLGVLFTSIVFIGVLFFLPVYKKLK